MRLQQGHTVTAIGTTVY